MSTYVKLPMLASTSNSVLNNKPMDKRKNVTERTYAAFSRLPRTDSYPFRSRVTPEYDRNHLILSITPASLLFALHRAREARELAVSYRDFNVGAAIVALGLGGPASYQVLTGINIKPDETSQLNGHAEQMAIYKANDRDFNAVSIVAIVGETQPDQQSGNHMHTLHPCGLCRDFMGEHPMIDDEATLFVTALPDLRTIELTNLAGLRRYHEDPELEANRIPCFKLPELKMLEPFQPLDQRPIVLDDSPETLAEERVWDGSVGAFTTQWRLKHLQ